LTTKNNADNQFLRFFEDAVFLCHPKMHTEDAGTGEKRKITSVIPRKNPCTGIPARDIIQTEKE
jgi:hypothetical protein